MNFRLVYADDDTAVFAIEKDGGIMTATIRLYPNKLVLAAAAANGVYFNTIRREYVFFKV
jgi:hypothetical protein